MNRSGSFSSSPLLGKYCGKDIPNIIPAHSNDIYLKFRSDMSKSYSGFKIIWDAATTGIKKYVIFLDFSKAKEFLGCGGTLTSPRGSIISPNYPEPYNSDATCEWKIRVNTGSKVQLVISDLDLEPHEFCSLDYIEVIKRL